MQRVYLTHPPAALEKYYGARAIAALKQIAEVRFNQAGRELGMPELAQAAQDCAIIISYRQTPGAAELFALAPNLVAFSRCAIDIRNVDVAAASAQGILVTQASAGFITAVAEWCIGALIDLSRGISASSEAYHAGRVPVAAMGRELRGSTLGVIGYGQISRALCPLALAFGMRVIVSDPYARVEASVDNPAITHTSLPELLGGSDSVICLAVASEETENLMNDAAFAQMKPGAFFINPSRGNLVDEAALLRALDSGHLAACAMDVGRAPDQMPTPALALARHPKIIATPHLGGLTPAAIEHQALETVTQAAEILQGRAPKGSVNAAQASRLAHLRPA